MADTFSLDEAYGSSPSETFGLDDAYGAQPAKTGRTQLSPEEEQRFQAEMQQNPWFQEFEGRYHEKPNLDDPSYDMRGAWKAGLKPSRDPYDNNAYHWPDFTPDGQQLKSDDHPTLWMGKFENATGQNPEALGLKDDAEARTWLAKNGYKADDILGAGKKYPGIGRFAAMAEAQKAQSAVAPAGPKTDLEKAADVEKGRGRLTNLGRDLEISMRSLAVGSATNMGRGSVEDFTGLLKAYDAIDKGTDPQDAINLVPPRYLDAIIAYRDGTAEQRQAAKTEAQNVIRGAGQSVVNEQAKLEALGNSPALVAALQAASQRKYDKAWEAFKLDPIGIMASISAQSAAPAGLAIAGGAAGGVTGLAIGSGAGERIAGIYDIMSQAMADAGLDPKNPDDIVKAWRDPAFMAKVEQTSAIRSTVIGAFDALTAGVSSKLVAPLLTRVGVKPVAQAILGTGVEAAGGAAGEATAEVASGQPLDPGQVIAEGLGEVPAGVVEAGVVAVHDKKEGADVRPSAIPGTPPPTPSPSGSGPAPKPAGIRETAAATPPEVTPEDVASPLPTDLIAQGKKVIADAEAAKQADTVLEKVQLPATGTRVTVTYPGGKTASGVVSDAFTQANAELGIEDHGVRIKLDDGTTFEEFSSTIRQAGVTITPEVKPTKGEKAQPRGVEAGGVGESILNPEGENAGTIAPVTPAVTPTAPTFTVDEAYSPPSADVAQPAERETPGPVDAGSTPADRSAPAETPAEQAEPSPLIKQQAAKAWEIYQTKGKEAAAAYRDSLGHKVFERVVFTNELRRLRDEAKAKPAPTLKEKVAAKREEKRGAVSVRTEEELRAKPDLGPLFDDPKGDTSERAVLSSALEGRHSTKDPLTGNWKWLLRKGYATEGKGGQLTLTEAGRARLEEVSGGEQQKVEPTKPAGKVTPQVAPIAGMTPLGAKPAEKTEAERYEYPTRGPGEPENEHRAKRAVVDFMNGDITKVELLADLNKAKLEGPGTLGAITHRLLSPIGRERGWQDTDADRVKLAEAPEALAQQQNTPKPQETQKKTATPMQASKPGYGESNKLVTKDRAEELRARLRRKLNQINSGIDPEILAIGAELAAYHIEAGSRKFADFAKAVSEDLGIALEKLRPYLRGWYNGARDMMEDAGLDVVGMDGPDEVKKALGDILDAKVPPPAEAPAPERNDATKVADAFADAFSLGRKFATIVQARAFAGEILGRKIESGSEDAKRLEEWIEMALVARAKEIASQKKPVLGIYRDMVALYDQQPNLSERTSTSIENQAYSTPAPLAYLAAVRAGITKQSTVYEPSAGNGMLLIEAAPTNIVANELNPDRVSGLRYNYPEASIHTGDATTYDPGTTFDVVIANPPFGAVFKDGKRVKFPMQGTTTDEVDQAIVMKALASMKPGGRAVLIIGGKQGTDEERLKSYRSLASITFLKKLYTDYNVTDHFTVDGRLYTKQGAGWPVDVIVIEGKSTSKRDLPTRTVPIIYSSWNALEGKLNEGLDAAGERERSGQRDADRPPAPVEPSPIPGSPDAADQQPDLKGKPGGRSGAAPEVSGSGATESGAEDGGRSAGGKQRVAPGEERVQPGPRDNGSRSEPSATGPDAGGVPGAAVSRQERVNLEAETAHQVQYTPTSGARFAVGTLVPRNMQDAMSASLADLETRVGSIDKFVADKLGYSSAEVIGTPDRPGYFSAEQVDALALAIDNAENGGAFIIGDQTGVGKGRFVAAMLRYGLQRGLTPIFVTKDPGLYADMVRDLRDIGMPDIASRVLITNLDIRGEKAIPLSTTDDATDVLQSMSPAKHKATIREIADSQKLPGNYELVFTTYSQVQYGPKGAITDRQVALKALAGNSIIVLDESHEAGGTDAKKYDKETGKEIPSRADFVRELLTDARSVVYSSATYAKNPIVMSLYFRTDLSDAVPDIKQLGATIAAGGVPLQQVVANMLVESGQYARRERSFEGVKMDIDVFPTDQELAKTSGTVLRNVFRLDADFMQSIRQAYADEQEAGGTAAATDNAVGDAGTVQVGFASVMHNVISQMLLSLKAPAVVDKAIAQHKAGLKPIIALSNTNEGIISEYIEDAGIKVGDPVTVDFKVIMQRYLRRLRRVTLKDSNKEPYHVMLTDQDIKDFGGEDALAEYQRIEAMIRDTDLSALPGSPIDYILDRLRAAGIKAGEITGRQDIIENGVHKKRKASAAEKKKVMNAYNGGALDALVINRSGSTGFSMHAVAGKKGNDGRKRSMLILQPDANIDVFMQILGRIHRTGQTSLPEYTIGVSDLAVEKRLAAVLMRKMASLNANTTASKKSAVSLDNVTDFLNQYGDEVVGDYLNENPEIANMLDLHVGPATQDLASKFTGRLAILEPEAVTAIYAEIEDSYRRYIEALDRLGQNALEAKTLDLDAKPVSETVLTQDRGSSPFQKGAVIETMDVKKQGKPYSWAEVKAELETVLKDADVRGASAYVAKVSAALTDKMDPYLASLEADVEKHRQAMVAAKTETQKERADEAIERSQQAINSAKAKMDIIEDWISRHRPGSAHHIKIGDEEDAQMVVAVSLGVDISKVGKNPTAASNIQARFAIADAGRELHIPLSKLVSEKPAYHTAEITEIRNVENAFEEGLSESREKRDIITGNLLTGFSTFRRGQIVMFKTHDGVTRQGIMLPKEFNAANALARRAVKFETGAQIAEFLTSPEARMVKTEDGIANLTYNQYQNEFALTINLVGGKPYFLNKAVRDILGDFQQRKGQKTMSKRLTKAQLEKVVTIYQENLGTVFQTTTSKDAARKVTGEKLPETKAARRPEGDDEVSVSAPRSFWTPVSWTPEKVGDWNDGRPDFHAYRLSEGMGFSRAALDQAAREWVLARGGASVEYLVAVNGDRDVSAAGTTNIKNRSVVPLSAIAWLQLPNQNVTVHHNHPNETSLSPDDSAILAFPGASWIVAHGSDRDSVYAARPGPLLAQARDPNLTGRFRAMLKIAHDFAEGHALALVRDEFLAGTWTAEDGDLLFTHAGNLALAKTGLTDYIAAGSRVEKVNARAEEIADAIAPQVKDYIDGQSFFEEVSISDRPAGILPAAEAMARISGQPAGARPVQSQRGVGDEEGRGAPGGLSGGSEDSGVNVEHPAFHGSPHRRIKRFSTGKIGTGEGAQAFGWGLYFAGKKALAQFYRDKLAGFLVKGLFGARAFDPMKELKTSRARSLLADTGNDPVKAIRWAELTELQSAEYRDNPDFMADMTVLQRLTKRKLVKGGNLYHVELQPKESEYLLWDKSISDQSDSVQRAIYQIRNEVPALADLVDPSEDSDAGATFYHDLAKALGKERPPVGSLVWQVEPDRTIPDPEAASKLLAKHGVPGIKYLNGVSRDQKESDNPEDYNYVIFDDKDVTITNVEATRRSVASFDSAESERRWQDARQGAASQESMLSNLSAWWERLAHGFTRHYIELPNEARFSDVREQLRKLEAAPQASKEQVVRILKDITKGMTRADLDLFTRKVVLDDLTWEASQDHELPFGFTAADVAREKAKIDAIVEGRPEIAQAVRTRKLIVRRVADQLVEAGVLNREQVQNPAYYRHQVLDFARAEIAYAKGVGKKLKSPYWARRHGSALDINANLLEAEFDWLHKAFTDVATAKTIKWIRDSEHNVRRQVIAAAKAHNDAGVAQALAADLRDNGYVDSKGRQTSPLNEQWKSFRQRIAFGLSTVRKAIENGMDIPPQFQDAADRVSDPDANDADIFPFLAHILDNDLDGAIGAAMAFKAIAARRQFVKDLLGNRYADTSDMDGLIKMGLAPEGYVSWQPNQPNKAGKALVFYTSKSLPEHAIERFAELAMSDLPLPPEARGAVKAAFMAQARDVLAVGGPQYQMVIPQELADTLSSIRDQHVEDLIHYLAEVPLGWWKKWVLINPRRVLKYNINNFSGDLDAVIAGNPRAVKKLPQAIKELMDVMYRGQTPSETFKDAVERGVFDSALSVQEIPDVNKLAEFSRLLERPSILKQPQRLLTGPAGAIWRGLSRFTSFRENWLRYAAYLDYVEQIENGAPMSKVGYGAALPAMVDAVEDTKDRAALLARELVGDYGAVSHYGQGIRRRLIPFYSWMEINTKRYWRLSGNAFRQGVGTGLATSGYLGAAMGIRTTLWLGLRMALMYGLVQLWNHLFFPDEEEKMSPEDRARLHLNLGTWDGEAKTLRFQGAFSDFLGWIGFEDVKATFSEIEKGRADYVDVLTTIAKAPVNKVLTGITPLITAPVQTLSGYTFWPDVFNPRPIRDEWRNLAQTFSLENEYDLAAGRPSRGYAKSFEGAVITSRDQGEQAYNNTRTLTYNWLQREKGQEGSSNFSTPKSEAIYQWKLAKRFGDTEAETRLRRQLREMGVTGDKLKEAIDNAHPLARIPMKDRARFKRSLDSREIEQLNLAIRWYRETFGD